MPPASSGPFEPDGRDKQTCFPQKPSLKNSRIEVVTKTPEMRETALLIENTTTQTSTF